MNKFLSSLLASTLLLGVVGTSFALETTETIQNTEILQEIHTDTLSTGLSAEAAVAYAGVIENVIAVYGDNPAIDNYAVETGLTVARLVDFDSDGVKELYVSYISHVDYQSVEQGANSKTIKEEIWAYTDSGVKQVWSTENDLALGWNSPFDIGTIFLPYNGETLLVNYSLARGVGNSRFCSSDYVILSYSNGTMKEVQTLSANGSVDLGATLTGSYNVTYEIDGISKKDSFYYSLEGDSDDGWYAYFDHDFLTMSNKKYDISKLEDIKYFSGWEFSWTYENCLPELKSTSTTPTGTPVSGFSDVRSTDWFAPYVQYVRENTYGGLMEKGFTSTSFNPYGQATRGMVAEVVTNLFYGLGYGIGGHDIGYQFGNNDNFPDARGSEFELDIYFCKGSIFAGYPDGTVGVNDPITREAFAVALYAAYGEGGRFSPEYLLGLAPTDTSTLNQFSDKNEISGWATTAVAWAVSNGVMSGSDGAINPQGYLSRAELAVVAKKCHEEFYIDPASGL